MEKKIKYLLLDDSNFMLKVISNLINQAGYEDVTTCSDVEKFYTLYNQIKPDIVFIDLNLKGTYGLDVLTKVLKINKNTICLISTSVDQNSVKLEAKKLGAKGYLVKPYDLDNVKEAIQKALE